MNQRALFHESITDALRDVIRGLGGFKVVGASMRKDMPADHAGRWLMDCLNDERREKLSPGEVLYLLKRGREAGLHDAMNYIAESCGYADPHPEEPEDERAALQREYIEAAKAMAKIADRIERMSDHLKIGRVA